MLSQLSYTPTGGDFILGQVYRLGQERRFGARHAEQTAANLGVIAVRAAPGWITGQHTWRVRELIFANALQARDPTTSLLHCAV